MKYLKIVIIVGIVLVSMFFFLKNVDFAEVSRIISSINPIYPAVFLLGLYVQFYIRAYRWGLILKPHKAKIPIFTIYSFTVIGFFLNTIFPGKIGEAARGVLLAGEQKISRSYGLASVVLERLIDSLVMVLLFIISLFFIHERTPLLNKLRTLSFFALPLIILVFLFFYFLNIPQVFAYVERFIIFISRLVPSRLRERAVSFGLKFVKGLRLNLSPLDSIKLLIASMIVWAFLIPFYWLLMKGFDFGANLSPVEAMPYFFVVAASASIPTPGMAGSFDAASRLALQELYNADTNPAAAFTILCHFLILVIMVVPGFLAFWMKGINLNTIRSIKNKTD